MLIKSLLATVVLASAFVPSFADQQVAPAPVAKPIESELSLAQSVPAEPSNYALMLAAVGVLAFVAHRRGRRS